LFTRMSTPRIVRRPLGTRFGHVGDHVSVFVALAT
jgi:hypothetical protein